VPTALNCDTLATVPRFRLQFFGNFLDPLNQHGIDEVIPLSGALK